MVPAPFPSVMRSLSYKPRVPAPYKNILRLDLGYNKQCSAVSPGPIIASTNLSKLALDQLLRFDTNSCVKRASTQ